MDREKEEVAPPDAEDAAEAVPVVGVEAAAVGRGHGPRLAPVEEYGENEGVQEAEFVPVRMRALLHTLDSLPNALRASCIRLVISGLVEQSGVNLEPR